eukprot:5628470-Prymnesium_polylepis.1
MPQEAVRVPICRAMSGAESSSSHPSLSVMPGLQLACVYFASVVSCVKGTSRVEMGRGHRPPNVRYAVLRLRRGRYSYELLPPASETFQMANIPHIIALEVELSHGW